MPTMRYGKAGEWLRSKVREAKNRNVGGKHTGKSRSRRGGATRKSSTASTKPANIQSSKPSRATPIKPASKSSKPTSKPSNKPVKTVKTKGGDYKVYRKGSDKAKSFRSAYAAAKKAGKKTFTWDGRKYTTD